MEEVRGGITTGLECTGTGSEGVGDGRRGFGAGSRSLPPIECIWEDGVGEETGVRVIRAPIFSDLRGGEEEGEEEGEEDLEEEEDWWKKW